MLVQAGWQIHDLKDINPGAALGVTVREYPTSTGPADYILFVNREPVGVLEAHNIKKGKPIWSLFLLIFSVAFSTYTTENPFSKNVKYSRKADLLSTISQYYIDLKAITTFKVLVFQFIN